MTHVPNEIVDRILECLYRDCRDEKPTCIYASVCPFWRDFFEKKHFSELSLTWRDLPELKDYVVGGRRRLVNRISLKILFGYTESFQPKAELYDCMITKFFEILGAWWDIFNNENPGKMELQIKGVFWPSFSLAFMPEQFQLIYEPRLSRSRMPPVYAVKSLILDQDAHGIFQGNPKTLHYLMRSLPVLGLFTSENHMGVCRDSQPSEFYAQMFRSLPASVSELSLVRESSDQFYFRAPWTSEYMLQYNMRQTDCLGPDLARVSRQLRHLVASFVVDAKDFFQPFWPQLGPSTARPINTDEWVWNELETLALTTQLLRRPHENETAVNHLLQAVSVAIRRMPKLRTLEIWNGDDDRYACVFHYSYSPASGRVSLGLQGTREINITQDTKRSWGETVRQKAIMESECEIWFRKLEIVPPFMAEAVSLFLALRDRVATERVRKYPPRLCTIPADPKDRH